MPSSNYGKMGSGSYDPNAMGYMSSLQNYMPTTQGAVPWSPAGSQPYDPSAIYTKLGMDAPKDMLAGLSEFSGGANYGSSAFGRPDVNMGMPTAPGMFDGILGKIGDLIPQGLKDVQWMDKIDPQTNTKSLGALGQISGVGSALMNAFLGYGQLQEAKQNNAFNQGVVRSNMGNQAMDYNRKIEERSRRLAAEGYLKPNQTAEQYTQSNSVPKFNG